MPSTGRGNGPEPSDATVIGGREALKSEDLSKRGYQLVGR